MACFVFRITGAAALKGTYTGAIGKMVTKKAKGGDFLSGQFWGVRIRFRSYSNMFVHEGRSNTSNGAGLLTFSCVVRIILDATR